MGEERCNSVLRLYEVMLLMTLLNKPFVSAGVWLWQNLISLFSACLCYLLSPRGRQLEKRWEEGCGRVSHDKKTGQLPKQTSLQNTNLHRERPRHHPGLPFHITEPNEDKTPFKIMETYKGDIFITVGSLLLWCTSSSDGVIMNSTQHSPSEVLLTVS